ncbi:MAG: DHA2 family efflux MFS transporter permease subunit [Oxalobacter sp.]
MNKEEARWVLDGHALIVTALVLATGNFVAILDTSIANVSVAHIAGGLGASNSQGTWVITSYAVAEAIMVPLTGWLAKRFGAVKIFCFSLAGFGFFSAMCGLANSMGMLIVARVLQGLSGGPLMPLSLTLMLRIFGSKRAHTANGLWATTTLIAPVAGPILGGWLCDEYSWPWIFLINVPFAFLSAIALFFLFRTHQEKTDHSRIDRIGLLLLIVWVAALQIMLDEGKDHDWFESNYIVTLGIIAAIGFAAFMIWELTEPNPVVDLKVFRHSGYWTSVLSLTLAFGAFFSINVITPLWLQTCMDYTSTWAGLATAVMGVAALTTAPLSAKLTGTKDCRKLIFCGILWMAMVTYLRSFMDTDVDIWIVSAPLFCMGFGLPFMMVPISVQAMMSVQPEEMDSAAGLMNFCRTLSGAVATSIVNTIWENQTNYKHEQLSYLLDSYGEYFNGLIRSGIDPEVARGIINQITTGQSIMLSTNTVTQFCAAALAIAAFSIWFGPDTNKIREEIAKRNHSET